MNFVIPNVQHCRFFCSKHTTGTPIQTPMQCKERPALLTRQRCIYFLFSIIVPAKRLSFESCTDKSREGENGCTCTAVIAMFWNTTYDIVPCTLNSLHIGRHKSGGGGGKKRSIVCPAVVQRWQCLDTTDDIVPCSLHFLHLCRRKSKVVRGKTDLQCSSSNYRYVLKHNIWYCTVYTKLFIRLYRHKSGRKKGSTVWQYSSSTAVIAFGHNGLSAVNAFGTQYLRDPIKSWLTR